MNRESQAQCDSTEDDEGCLDSNVKHNKKLTKLSVSQLKRSTELYLLARRPRALDKHTWRTDNGYNTEAHTALQPTGGDCGEQSLNQQDTFVSQQSQCDSSHTSHDAMREHIAEGGEMEYIHLVHPTHQNHGPYLDQDSDDSSSSEYEVANKEFGTRHEVSDELDKHSKSSENSRNTLSEMYGLSVHSDQQLETVHMACIWEVHHYQVDRDSDDGEPHPEYEDDYGDYQLRDGSTSPMLFEDGDGQLWSYEDEIIPCNDAQERGQNCESPVERHWVESKAPRLGPGFR